jgi:hypothetical protein
MIHAGGVTLGGIVRNASLRDKIALIFVQR